MGKRNNIDQLTKFLTYAVVHRIGSIVNNEEIYANKYKKESESFMESAREVFVLENWNIDDKNNIKQKLKKRVYDELLKRNFLDKKKFEIMDAEINKILRDLELN